MGQDRSSEDQNDGSLSDLIRQIQDAQLSRAGGGLSEERACRRASTPAAVGERTAFHSDKSCLLVYLAVPVYV